MFLTEQGFTSSHAVPEGFLERLAEDRGWTRSRAELATGEMLKFLHACHRSGETLVPSADVDEAWHLFILHTRDYQEYCEREFGGLIHHVPGTRVDAADRYRRTRQLIEDWYGIEADCWPSGAADRGRCAGP
jgi:hypothetical protein